MFFKWGAHTEVKEVGPCGVYRCGPCGADREFRGMLTYRVRHVYWIFRWVTNKERERDCLHCGYSYPAEPGSFDAAAEQRAIPFLDRRGWTLGVGALAGVVALVGVAVVADSRENRAYLAVPRVGDVYEVNAADLMVVPEGPRMYSAMRVTGVEGDNVTLQMGKTYFDELRGIQDDVREGRTRDDDYYMEEAILLTRADLAALYEGGTITDVER